jgi:hypothetical protein
MTSMGAALVLSCGMAAATIGTQQPKAEGPRVNAEALVLQDFKQRIDKYMELHKRLEKDGPRLKRVDDPAKIQASQEALATAIRSARADAKQGDILTPEIADRLRRLISPEVAGVKGIETKEAIKEDAPAAVVLKVNGPYPADAPLPTVPPNLLANLPQLPEDLEYRIIGRDLILRDVHANLIVDFARRIIR